MSSEPHIHSLTFRHSGMFNLKPKDIISKPQASLNKTAYDNENNYKTYNHLLIGTLKWDKKIYFNIKIIIFKFK